MAYVALYRKWRPVSFKDLVGQDHISRTLSKAITTGKIGHAFLFSGPRGTGKTSTAKILARALNCDKGPTPDPCGECENCRHITDGSSMDVLEIDAASNRGIDEIRDLRETVNFAPVSGRYKVYIIDEVHMLTTEAFNALLKTLEEPPAHVVFILATTEAHKVPITIQSRCQRYDFKRITVEDIRQRLAYVAEQMGLEVDEEAFRLIALQSDGGMRDALGLLDQCSVLADGRITGELVCSLLGLVGHDWIWKLTDEIINHDAGAVLQALSQLIGEGRDHRQILNELVLHFRSLMIYRAAGTLGGLDLYLEPEEVLQRQSQAFDAATVMAIISRLHGAMNELKWSPQPRITVEMALLEICHNPQQPAEAESSGAINSASGLPNTAFKPGDGNQLAMAPSDAGTAAATAATAATTAATAALNSKVASLENLIRQLGAKVNQLEKRPLTGNMAMAKPKPVIRKASPAFSPEQLAKLELDPDLWQEILQELGTMGEPNMQAWFVKGQYRGCDDHRLVVSFTNDMFTTRAMGAYREKMETAIENVSGDQLELVCYTDEAPEPEEPPQVAENTGHPGAPDQPPLPDYYPEDEPVDLQRVDIDDAERDQVLNAMDMLGGKVMGIEDK